MEEYNGRKVQYMLCSDCNANCKHCYINFRGRKDSKIAKNELNLLKNKYDVRLNGAEILVNMEYLPLFKIVHQHYIMTNGMALYMDPSKITFLKENGINTVSLSCHFGIQSKISAVEIDIVRQVIIMCNEKKVRVRLLTTLCKENVNNIEQIIETSIKLGVEGIKFTN